MAAAHYTLRIEADDFWEAIEQLSAAMRSLSGEQEKAAMELESALVMEDPKSMLEFKQGEDRLSFIPSAELLRFKKDLEKLARDS